MKLSFRRRNKYFAKPVSDGGLRFDSTAEWRRWLELKLLEKAGQIRNLRHHPIYDLNVNGFLVCRYEADADYEERDQRVIGKWLAVTEDTKSPATITDVFKLKAKLMLACHQVHVRLVGKGMQRAT